MVQLTPKQQEIIDSPAHVKLVMGGMLSGKTILAMMAAWDMMKKGYPRVLFLVPSDRYIAFTEREIRSLLPVENIIEIEHRHDNGPTYVLIKTDCGELIIADRFIPISIDGIVLDNATSSKHVYPELLERLEPIYATGHCPTNMNNNFFLMWLKMYFSDDTDKKAFRLGTWENPSMSQKEREWAERLPSRMGKGNYNQQYLCIPDFTDCIEPPSDDWARREYIKRGIECIKRNEINFPPKSFYIEGFDKARE